MNEWETKEVRRLVKRVEGLERDLHVEKALRLTFMICLYNALGRIGANDEESIAEREQLYRDIDKEVSK